VPADELFKRAKAAAKQQMFLLIADEIQTGIARTVLSLLGGPVEIASCEK